jgi:hydroxyacylglutathione hydrolase
MIFERVKSEGLAHNSYFLGSGGTAAVIDPRRDIQVYLDLAREHSLKIKYIFETHRNEDYVIGSLELAGPTGAAIYHGPLTDFKYGNVLRDGQEFALDKLKLTAIQTPGHTDDSMSYLVTDLSTGPAPVMVFTGDALFVNDTGRIDFGGLGDAPRMASNLYDSIFNRLLVLGDGVIIYPGHGSGSVCGTRIASRDESSLGIERLQNPALKHTEKTSFVRLKTSEAHEYPHYFKMMEKLNLEGPPVLGRLPSPPALSPLEFAKVMEKGALVIDASLPPAFGGAHIQGAYSIWLEGLPGFAGWVLPYEKPLLLVLEDDARVDQAVRYLIRLGYDNLAGYLEGGTEAWYVAGLPVESLNLLTVHDLKAKIDRGEALTVLDVRSREEWDAAHIAGAKHIYVGHVEQRLAEIPRDQPVAVLCTVGHRAGVAASLLLRAGFSQVSNVIGSMAAWRQAGYPTVSEVKKPL